MDIDFKLIGEQIRLKRVKLDYAQTYVADKAGMSHKSYSKLEHGDAKGYLASYINIAEVFNMSLDTMLKDIYDPNSELFISMLINELRAMNPNQRKLVLELIQGVKKFSGSVL